MKAKIQCICQKYTIHSSKAGYTLGVTRARIIQLADKLNIKTIEESIHKSFLK